MPAARYWRAVGLEAHAGGDLELSALHVYDAGGRVDAGATLTSTIAPAAGALASLQDSDFGTTARFAAAAVSSPGFALRWDFGAPVDVYGVRAGGSDTGRFLKSLTLQYSSDGETWGAYAAGLGDFIYPGAAALTAAPVSAPWLSSEVDLWISQGDAGGRNCQSAAMSADGRKLLAGSGDPGSLWRSDDGGANWAAQTTLGSRYWVAAAVSADGQKMLAGDSAPGNIWRSDDGGATWAAQTSLGSRSWRAVAMSSDGQKMLAAPSGGNMWRSDDGGTTWATLTAAGSRPWYSVSMSANGQKMLAAVSGGGIWRSDDGGATWAEQTSLFARSWTAVSVSADGQKMLAAATLGSGGNIWRSNDGGVTWAAEASVGVRNWRSVAMSADGQKVLAGDNEPGNLWRSNDGGTTWAAYIAAGSRLWSSVAMSSDGQRMLSGVGSNEIAGNLFFLALRDPMFADPPPRAIAADTPDFFASSPMPDFTTIKLPDVMPWRDMEFAGNGKVVGTVKEKNTPANTPLRRRVRLVREIDGLQIRETWSDAATGTYEFLQIDERHKYSVISYDHLGNYRAVIADNLTPELMQ